MVIAVNVYLVIFVMEIISLDTFYFLANKSCSFIDKLKITTGITLSVNLISFGFLMEHTNNNFKLDLFIVSFAIFYIVTITVFLSIKLITYIKGKL